MTDAQGAPRCSSWSDLCPWLILFRTFRLATGMRLLLLASAGSLATAGGWRVVHVLLISEDLLATDESLRADLEQFNCWPFQRHEQFHLRWTDRMALLDKWTSKAPEVPIVPMVYQMVEPVRKLLDCRQPLRAWAFYLIGGVWTVCVWSLFGGAISRIAAIYLGREEQVGLRQSLIHGWKKWGSHLAAVGLSIFGFIMTCVPMLVLGWIMRLEIGVLAAGLLWLPVLAAGFVLVVLAFGLLFGWPLMWGVIGCESSDSFDAISRAYAYTFQRPLQYAWYVFVACAFGLVGWLVVWVASEAVIQFGFWGTGLGTGSARGELISRQVESILLPAVEAEFESTGSGNGESSVWRIGMGFIAIAVGLVRMLASAFAASYFWCAATGIYLLLRLQVDEAELDDIKLEEETSEQYGLPPLPVDAIGNSPLDRQGDSGGSTSG